MKSISFTYRITLIVLLLSASFASAQQQFLTLDRDFMYQYDKFFIATDSNMHTAVKPFNLAEVRRHGFVADEVPEILPKGFLLGKEDAVSLEIMPLISLSGGIDLSASSDHKVPVTLGGGVQVNAGLGKKLFINGMYYSENSAFPEYMMDQLDTFPFVPGTGLGHKTGLGYESHFFRGYLSYSPNDIFNFQFGKGKNFFGDGYRSLQLSDNAANYPFLKISTSVWNIKYVNLYSAYKTTTASQNFGWNPDRYNNKYTTTHFLSWNITRNINVNLFETIIWQGEDTLIDRGFDMDYLNPVIFYRPVEFSQGSSDNALVGAGAKVDFLKKHQFYGQFVLDEFLLQKILDGNGWWANKYGVQIGYKGIDLFGIENLSLQSEFNFIRPYTFAHITARQSYAHMHQPLAHPIGANFNEWVNIASYRKNNWVFEHQFNLASYGVDSSWHSYGQDILKPYGWRVEDFGNEIAQGIKNTVLYNHFRAALMLSEKMNLKAEAGMVLRNQYSELGNQHTSYFYIAIRTAFMNRYADY